MGVQIHELTAAGALADADLLVCSQDGITVNVTFGDLAAAIPAPAASAVSYDNTTSGLVAADTQAALDELAAASGGGPVSYAENGDFAGYLPSAAGVDAVAIGRGSQYASVSDGDYGVAIGGAEIASYSGGVAIGEWARNFAQAGYPVAIGYGSAVNQWAYSSVAIGRNSQAFERESVALGYMCESHGENSIAIGRNCAAYKFGSVALGYNAKTAVNHEFAVANTAATKHVVYQMLAFSISDATPVLLTADGQAAAAANTIPFVGVMSLDCRIVAAEFNSGSQMVWHVPNLIVRQYYDVNTSSQAYEVINGGVLTAAFGAEAWSVEIKQVDVGGTVRLGIEFTGDGTVMTNGKVAATLTGVWMDH